MCSCKTGCRRRLSGFLQSPPSKLSSRASPKTEPDKSIQIGDVLIRIAKKLPISFAGNSWNTFWCSCAAAIRLTFKFCYWCCPPSLIAPLSGCRSGIDIAVIEIPCRWLPASFPKIVRLSLHNSVCNLQFLCIWSRLSGSGVTPRRWCQGHTHNRKYQYHI